MTPVLRDDELRLGVSNGVTADAAGAASPPARTGALRSARAVAADDRRPVSRTRVDPRLSLTLETRLEADDVPDAVRPLVLAAREGGDPAGALGESVRALGFDWFSFLLVRRDSPGAESRYTLWSNFPAGWTEVYRERNYMAVDPRFRAAMRSAVPEVWDRHSYPDEPRLREFFDTAASFGLRSGVFMVVNQPNPGCIEFFAVGSTQGSIDDARRQSIACALGDLWALGAYGHRLLASAVLKERSQGTELRRLSARELECLNLAAQGATSRVIAAELGISERTVNAHLERAIRKCGARNRQEAVARGISGGLISL
jgi:DNA-binding CsgD family transcriptional regulator